MITGRICDAWVNEKAEVGEHCGKSATWSATWSDRGPVDVCDDHKDYVYECYKSDHSYDQTGLEWRHWPDGQYSVEDGLTCIYCGNYKDNHKMDCLRNK